MLKCKHSPHLLQAVTMRKETWSICLKFFSSTVSLKDIASAYCHARRNVEMAAEILCRSHISSSDAASSSKVEFKGASTASSEALESEQDGASAVPARVSSDKSLQKPFTRASKSKKISASMGSVSGMIGKEYTRPRPSANDSTELKKPLKLDLIEVPASEIWKEEVQSTMPAKNSKLHADAEAFLFKMLGEGFKLDMTVIREVLGLCGYDVQQSMDKLLFMPASTLEKSDDVVGLASSKSAGKCPDQHSAHSDGSGNMNLVESPVGEKDGFSLQQQVVEALFQVPERSEEAPKRSLPAREVKRYKYEGFKRTVVEPFRDTLVECKTTVAPQKVTGPDGDEENSYEVLRKSVKEYWITMKEYYKAAFDSFCEGDRVSSAKLLDKGHFFNKKAREADEKSAQILAQDQSREDDVYLDLHHHEPKEAIRLLKLQLTHLSGIPAFKYLRVIVGTNDEDTTGGSRRRLIVKQLEKESIKWIEEENGRTILIQVDVIDPKRLSFSKKISERNKGSPYAEMKFKRS